MIYKIYNTSDADVTISNVVFTALDYTVLLDTDDVENPVLTNGIKLANSCSSEVGVYVTDGTFTFYEDDVLQDIEEYYRIANNWIEMLKGSGTAFYDDGTGQYFDLEDKQLKIYNPVTEVWETGYADGLIDYKLDISALEDGSLDITPSSISIANCVSTDAAIANYHLYDIAAGDLTTAVRVRAFGVAYAGDYSDRIEHIDVTLSCNTDGDLVVASTGMNGSDTGSDIGTVVNVRAYKKDDDSFMIVAATASNVNANFVIEVMDGTSFKTCGYLNDMTLQEFEDLSNVYGYSCVYTSTSKANTIFTAGSLKMDNLEDAEILGSGSRGQIFDNTSYVTSALALKADSTDMTTALAGKLDGVFVDNIPTSSSTLGKWLKCATITTPAGTYQSKSFTFYTSYQDSNGYGTTPMVYDITINNSYSSTGIVMHSLSLHDNNTDYIGYIISGFVMTVYIKVPSNNFRLRTRFVTHRGYDTDVEIFTSCTPTSTAPTYLGNRYNYPKSSGIIGTNSTGAVITSPNIKTGTTPTSGAAAGLYYKIMTVPYGSETFGGTVNYETWASGNSTQKSGSFSVHAYAAGTITAKRLNGATLYYTRTDNYLNIFIISCSSGMKLRFFVPTAGSVDDGQLEMDWLLTAPQIYGTGDAIIMVDM